MEAKHLAPEHIETIFEWDMTNWSRCITFFQKHLETQNQLTCLELGGRRGGMSFWMALNGHDVICSDLTSPEEIAGPLHGSYELKGSIQYSAIDALDISYENHFDLIMFKSVLGGVSREGNDQKKAECLQQIYKALKPGGKVIIAENLTASWLHRSLRKRFVKWGGLWNYLEYHEVDELFQEFRNVRYHSVGFFGAFGRTENQRRFLGKIDKAIDRLVPKSMRYIVFVIATK
ncbi:MAG: class I SAM-dependent methyltransferase [Flavobacteriales bacterium]|nr:class I SAM-dependent methyltransferase [Flavobacteriales bacterium]NNK81193.1 class I SAM-dependent methyltransferase [Flavobacteriales bacterium]